MAESTNNLNASDDELTLNLPDGRDYRPVHVPISFEAHWLFCEAQLEQMNGRPGAMEERWARKCFVPFQFHPEDLK